MEAVEPLDPAGWLGTVDLSCEPWDTCTGHLYNHSLKSVLNPFIHLLVIVFQNSFHSKARTCF